MTPEESDAYEYIKGLAGSWVSEDDLVLLGIDTDDLDTIFATYPLIQSKYDSDQTISHGLRVSLTDGSNVVYALDQEWLKPQASLSLRVLVCLDDYIDGATQYLLYKYNGYRFYIDSLGKFNIDIWDGSTSKNYKTTSANTLINPECYWLRADWTYDAGGGNSSVDFKFSDEYVFDSEEVEVWTDIETVTKTQHAIVHSTNNLYINGISSGSTAEGSTFCVEVWGEDARRLDYDLSYNAQIPVGVDTIFDNLGNVLVIDGGANFLMQNNIPVKYYQYQSDMGAFDPV